MRNEEFVLEDTRAKMKQVLSQHDHICVSVSGGADSDCLIELFEQERQPHHNIAYLFMDTGLEFKATKEHLKYLEERYSISITRYRGDWNIPRAVKKYGVPLFNKKDSKFIRSAQANDFDFNLNNTLEQDLMIIPSTTAHWWHRTYPKGFSISEKRKQFLNKNKIDFKVSQICCEKVKKNVALDFIKKHPEFTLMVVGIRRSEGGVRNVFAKDCYDVKKKKYYPLLHWDDDTRNYFISKYNIKHSDCYEVWGFKRTGCAGCPFSRTYKEDLEKIKKYEPLMYQACNKVFGDSYRYLENYDSFKKTKKDKK